MGGWVSHETAITARLAGVTPHQDGADVSQIFLGPSIQYWASDNVWLGGGLGISIAALTGSGF